MDYLKNKNLDFRPSIRLRGDTGANNGPLLFKNIDFSNYILIKERHICFDDSHDIEGYGYTYIDCGWIHCWNASNYFNKKNLGDKMKLIYAM